MNGTAHAMIKLASSLELPHMCEYIYMCEDGHSMKKIILPTTLYLKDFFLITHAYVHHHHHTKISMLHQRDEFINVRAHAHTDMDASRSRFLKTHLAYKKKKKKKEKPQSPVVCILNSYVPLRRLA